MPRKRMSHRTMRGRGVLDWLRKAHDFIKKHKLVSRIGKSLGAVGVPYAGTIGSAAGALGYGRLADIHHFIKSKRLISRVGASLHKAGVPYAGRIGAVAKHLGYGRRRRHRGGALRLAGGRRRHRGGSLHLAGGHIVY